LVGIQKTIKQNFLDHELDDLTGQVPFSWRWTPARGRCGGILMGVREYFVEIESWEALALLCGHDYQTQIKQL